MKRKLLATAVALVTLCTCLFTVTACKEKGNTDEGTSQIIQVAADGGMQITESKESGIRLMSASLRSTDYAAYNVSNQAESAYTLTATVYPSYATNPLLDWSVAWENPSSDWASGKSVTDYVSVVANDADNHRATLSCYQPFGEQVKVSVVAQSNSSAMAECTVDYSKKITGGYLRVTSNPNSAGNFFICNLTDSVGYLLDTTYEYTGATYVLPTYGTYTIEDTFVNSCSFSYSTEFMTAITSQTNTITGTNHQFNQIMWDMMSEEMPYTVTKIVESMSHPDPSTQNQYVLSITRAKSMIYELLAANPDMIIGYISVSCIGDYSRFDNEIAVRASDEVLVQEATAVELDEGSYVF